MSPLPVSAPEMIPLPADGDKSPLPGLFVSCRARRRLQRTVVLTDPDQPPSPGIFVSCRSKSTPKPEEPAVTAPAPHRDSPTLAAGWQHLGLMVAASVMFLFVLSVVCLAPNAWLKSTAAATASTKDSSADSMPAADSPAAALNKVANPASLAVSKSTPASMKSPGLAESPEAVSEAIVDSPPKADKVKIKKPNHENKHQAVEVAKLKSKVPSTGGNLASAIPTKSELPPAEQGCFKTAVEFVGSPTTAMNLARNKKLVFILHVSGNFEDPGFT